MEIYKKYWNFLRSELTFSIYCVFILIIPCKISAEPQNDSKNMYDIEFKYFPEKIVKPTLLADSEKFLIKLAETEEEVKKTLHLRYRVFNLEQGKGLKNAFLTELDTDKFDEFCLQMIVVDKETNEPVGTYRVHLGTIATSNKMGFYSSSEYDITGLEKIASKTMELGRSCVLPECRTGAVIALLWGGIGELMMRAKLQYLMGCVSFDEINPAATWAIYDHFREKDLVANTIWGTPKKDYLLPRPPEEEIKPYALEIRKTLRKFIPPLLKGYLRLGTKICGEPLYDPNFGSIDFLVLLDTYTIPERYARHYNYNP